MSNVSESMKDAFPFLPRGKGERLEFKVFETVHNQDQNQIKVGSSVGPG